MKKDNLFKISMIMYIIPFLIGIIFYKQLPESLPVHFDVNGNPNSFQSKNFALFGIPIFMLLLQVVSYFISKKDPRKNYQGNKIINVMLIFMPFITTGLVIYTISYSLGFKYDITKISNMIIALFFIVIGNYLPKTKRNYTIGIRTSWTLDNDENWDKTHKMAGKLWVFGGISMLILSILKVNLYIIFAMILSMAFIPIIYSYFIYSKSKK